MKNERKYLEEISRIDKSFKQVKSVGIIFIVAGLLSFEFLPLYIVQPEFPSSIKKRTHSPKMSDCVRFSNR